MLRLLEPSIPGFLAENNGLRCLVHILHNAVQSMFTALHCEGFENEEVALDRLNLLPRGSQRQDLADVPERMTQHDSDSARSGPEITDFEVTLTKVRRLCFGVRCSDKRRRRLRDKCHQCGVSYRVPKGDAEGRWNSVYDMLTVLLHLCHGSVSWPGWQPSFL
jgi:hypothetical protein